MTGRLDETEQAGRAAVIELRANGVDFTDAIDRVAEILVRAERREAA